jgi:hypothetical protein
MLGLAGLENLTITKPLLAAELKLLKRGGLIFCRWGKK